jgi:hypothetical protein
MCSIFSKKKGIFLSFFHFPRRALRICSAMSCRTFPSATSSLATASISAPSYVGERVVVKEGGWVSEWRVVVVVVVVEVVVEVVVVEVVMVVMVVVVSGWLAWRMTSSFEKNNAG